MLRLRRPGPLERCCYSLLLPALFVFRTAAHYFRTPKQGSRYPMDGGMAKAKVVGEEWLKTTRRQISDEAKDTDGSCVPRRITDAVGQRA